MLYITSYEFFSPDDFQWNVLSYQEIVFQKKDYVERELDLVFLEHELRTNERPRELDMDRDLLVRQRIPIDYLQIQDLGYFVENGSLRLDRLVSEQLEIHRLNIDITFFDANLPFDVPAHLANGRI